MAYMNPLQSSWKFQHGSKKHNFKLEYLNNIDYVIIYVFYSHSGLFGVNICVTYSISGWVMQASGSPPKL
jgi:hypothetical protein